MRFPETYDFTIEDTNKAQVLKVLEEAAELVEADKHDSDGFHALEEAMDVLQALANYLELKGYTPADLQSAYDGVFRKNWERCYYDCNFESPLYEIAERHYWKIVGFND